ncbi:MAG: hypothetical protein D6714_05905 [Bacteroidetes bacterium]|nr:MAG: hypothetical protein D6714_05905 [Bacteroidota bacterium]
MRFDAFTKRCKPDKSWGLAGCKCSNFNASSGKSPVKYFGTFQRLFFKGLSRRAFNTKSPNDMPSGPFIFIV